MKILRQGAALQTYITTNIAKLNQSKTLVISSAPANNATKQNAAPQKIDHALKKFLSSIDQHVSKCEFSTSMQYNLKTVSYGKNALSGAYPTKNDIESTMELMRRTGATNIIGVGSGAAMDLAKICYYKNSEQDDSFLGNGAQLILNPSTLGAALTATSKDCLYLCTEEEALLPYYNNNSTKTRASRGSDDNSTTVLVDDKEVAVPMWLVSNHTSEIKSQPLYSNATVIDCAFASLVIALDAAHSMGGDDFGDDDDLDDAYRTILHNCVTNAMQCLDILKTVAPMNDSAQLNSAIAQSKSHAISTMLDTGKLLSFGDVHSASRRNISIALTSSLLPTYFPRGNWLTFTASLLPGVCHALGNHPYDEDNTAIENRYLNQVLADILRGDESNVTIADLTNWLDDIANDSSILPVPSLAKLAHGAPDTDELLNKLDENGVLLNCRDAEETYFESILVSSLNR